MIHRDFSRREFLGRAAMAGAAAALAPNVLSAEAATEKRFKIIAFSKPFQKLGPAETAELVADVGWDGVEMPVRKAGQVLPEKVEDDLPKFVEALRAKGRELTIATTDVTSVTPLNEKVLRAVSKLGIKRYRLGTFSYTKDKSIPAQLDQVAARLRDVAALNKELGLNAGFQNHSGEGRIGAPIWDIWTVIKDLDPKAMGYCFDIGHATIEGGMAWPTNFRLAEPRLTAVFVKDFYWQKSERGWRATWCPFGEGMVEKRFFTTLKSTKFEGPICQHHEYELGDQDKMIAHFKKDLAVLRGWLAA
jgi:sugar phosphate isomerase/epimerase